MPFTRGQTPLSFLSVKVINGRAKMCSVDYLTVGCVYYSFAYQLQSVLRSLSVSVLGWAPAVVRTTPESQWLYRQIHNHTHMHSHTIPQWWHTVTIRHLPTASLPVPLGTCFRKGGDTREDTVERWALGWLNYHRTTAHVNAHTRRAYNHVFVFFLILIHSSERLHFHLAAPPNLGSNAASKRGEKY